MKRLLGWLLGLLLEIVLAVVFYMSVILQQPQALPQVNNAQALPAASAVQEIAYDWQLNELHFPSAVLGVAGGNGFILHGGRAFDVPFEDGAARVLALRYQAPIGPEMTVYSIYPARAVEVMQSITEGDALLWSEPAGGKYHLTGLTMGVLLGQRAVRMFNSTSVRVHLQTDDALYAVVAERSAADQLNELLRPMQLFNLP